MRYLTAIRTASIAVSKQSDGDWAAMHRHRRLAVAAEHHLQQVGLLGLGRHPGARAGALDVDHDQRQLGHHAEPDGLGLERDARAGGGGHPEVAGEAGAQGGAHAGDLVLGLEGGDAEALVLAQLVQHVRGRGDRVGAEEQRQPGLAGGGDQPVRQREVARDLPVAARPASGPGPPRSVTAKTSVVSPNAYPVLKAVMLASRMAGLLANLVVRKLSVPSVGRW